MGSKPSTVSSVVGGRHTNQLNTLLDARYKQDVGNDLVSPDENDGDLKTTGLSQCQSSKLSLEMSPTKSSKNHNIYPGRQKEEAERSEFKVVAETDEEVEAKLRTSKQICQHNIDIIQTEADPSSEIVKKSLQMINGLYFLNKKSLMKRKYYRKSLSLYMVESKSITIIIDIMRAAHQHGWRDEQGQVIPIYYNVFYNGAQIFWNFSDASDRLAKEIVDEGVIELIQEVLSTSYQFSMTYAMDNATKKILKSCLAVIANCSFHEASRGVVKQSRILDVMSPLMTAGLDDLDIYFVLIPAYLVNEEQSEKLFHDQSIINNIVKHVEKATKQKHRRSRGFSVHELCVLIGRLAVNDVNKTSIVKAGAVPLLIGIVKGDKLIDEKIAAIEALRHLSFNEENQAIILQTEGAVELLETLQKHDNSKVRKAAEGTLWNLKNRDSKMSECKLDTKDEHVMISYQWGCQATILDIVKHLKKGGIKVWVDVENMEGSTLSAMADAVEQSEIVLIAISEKYKESANCRMEAEYAFQLRKKVIPLMMEDNYSPDGWLGLLLGAKLYYKFTESTAGDFESTTEKLLKAINDYEKSKSAINVVNLVQNVTSGGSRFTHEFDDILTDVSEEQKAKILIKQKSFEDSLEKVTSSVSRGEFNSYDNIRVPLYSMASLYSALKELSIKARRQYKAVLLKTFMNHNGLEYVLKVIRYNVKHGWRDDQGVVDDSYWRPFNTSISMMWNFTDASSEVCEFLLKEGFLDLVQEIQNSEGLRYLGNPQDAIAGRATRSTLACLYNCCLHAKSRQMMREANVVDKILSPMIGLQDERPRTYIIFIMAYTLNEEQSERFFADEELIRYIIGRLAKAVKHPSHLDGGYSALELTKGVRRLAINDSNKVQIVNADVLTPLSSLILDGEEDEQIAATETVWELSFNDDNKNTILKHAHLVEKLEQLRSSNNTQLKRACEGALWVLKDQDAQQERSSNEMEHIFKTDARDEVGHVMISYQWDNQNLMKRIKDRLRAEGYNVWMDIEQMGGSTLSAMADAVENAVAIVVCMTQNYKDSPNCRTEAEYAFQCRKKIVPIKVRSDYHPDGWLGAILGTKFYFQFLGEDVFESSLQAMMKELGTRGKVTNGVLTKRGTKTRITEKMVNATSVSGAGSGDVTSSSTNSARMWTKENVEKWIAENDLNRSKLEKITSGEQLLYLKELRREAPEFFHHYLETYFQLVDLTDMMTFTKSLEQLY